MRTRMRILIALAGSAMMALGIGVGPAAAHPGHEDSTDNYACRMEWPVLASSPGTSTGGPRAITGGTNLECLNLMLHPDVTMRVEVTLYWLNPETDAFEPLEVQAGVPYRKVCEQRTVSGVGTMPCDLDVVLPIGHEASRGMFLATFQTTAPYEMASRWAWG